MNVRDAEVARSDIIVSKCHNGHYTTFISHYFFHLWRIHISFSSVIFVNYAVTFKLLLSNSVILFHPKNKNHMSVCTWAAHGEFREFFFISRREVNNTCLLIFCFHEWVNEKIQSVISEEYHVMTTTTHNRAALSVAFF
mgnify:CR=1 FL=1